MRSITAVISRALICIASTAVRAWLVTPALMSTMSGLASTVSLTDSSTTGPWLAIWTSAACTWEAVAAMASAGIAKRIMDLLLICRA